jgi:hypothetical protein
MTTRRTQNLAALGAFLSAPFLFAADGHGCSGRTVCEPLPCPSNASWDSTTCQCVVHEEAGVADGGGDAGGDETPVCDPLSCPSGETWSSVACACVADVGDAGACVSSRGQRCGGNMTHPCTCAAGLVCTPGDGGGPFGDVGGTCEAPAPDGGTSCVALEGQHCGGNIAHPCTCAASLVCEAGDGGLPFGDVGGTCVRGPVCDPPGPCATGTSWDTQSCSCAPSCTIAADCTGALPALCASCSDGGYGCAHFACNAGRCETAFCD